MIEPDKDVIKAREKFELKISMEYEQPPCLDRDGAGYDDSYVDNAWWGWQAATEQSQKEVAEKDALITELEDYKNSVIDQFVTAHHSYDESISAYENISKLIAYHQDIALDPKVSSVAARWVTQIEALQAREKELVNLAKLTYGYLWHINAGLDAPAILNVTSITPEKCSHIVRKLWLDVLTKEQRGEGINKALEALANVIGDVNE